MKPERRGAGIHFKGNLTRIHLERFTSGLIAAHLLAYRTYPWIHLQRGLPVKDDLPNLLSEPCSHTAPLSAQLGSVFLSLSTHA